MQNEQKHRPFIIPIFLPHAGCPHQCVFCNQVSITGARRKAVGPDQFQHQVSAFLKYRKKDRAPVQIAFFGGNFLGLPEAEIQFYLEQAAEHVYRGSVDSIRFSTRPDTIDDRRLDILGEFPAATVELGAQSMDDRVLARSRRGHTAADTIQAVTRLKARAYPVGLQIMVGLPGDNTRRALASSRRVARLRPDFVRIYPTVVLAGSPLATWHEKGDYVPLSLDAAVSQAKALYHLFKTENIPVIRMGLQATEDFAGDSVILAGPYHPAFGHLVYSEIFLDMALSAIKSTNPKADRVGLHVHPRSVSKMRGLNNRNIEKLRRYLDLQSVEIVPDDALPEDQLKVKALT